MLAASRVMRYWVLLVSIVVGITGCKQLAILSFGIGASSADKGKYERSIAYYNIAIKLFPQFPDAYNSRGDAWVHMGNRENALIDFNKAIEINPQWAPPYDSRGTYWIAGGDTDAGIADYTRAIAIDPTYTDAYYDRGAAFILQKKDYDSAIRDFGSIIAINSKESRGYSARGLAFTYKGNYTKAIADFNTAIDLLPEGYPLDSTWHPGIRCQMHGGVPAEPYGVRAALLD